MPWTEGILLFTMTVMTLISSLRAGPEAFSETDAVYGAVSENTIRFGKLLIGAQGTVSGKEMGASALTSAEQSDKYQSKGQFRLAETKLHRLGPSVHCGSDSMTLRIPGAIRTPHFLVDRGDQSTVALSEMPASCGFSLKRARRDVSLVAPYQGCHVRQQGGSYILPLLVMGAPVQMSCPVSPPTPSPTTIAPVQDPLDSQQMFYPFPFGKPWWYPHSPGYPVSPTVPPTTMPPPPTTTTPPPVQDPYQHMFPHMYPMSMFDPYFHFSGSAAQWPRYPMFPPYMYHYKSPVEATTPPTTTTPTTTPTTTTPTTAAQFEQFAGYPPIFYGPQPLKFFPPGVKYPFMP